MRIYAAEPTTHQTVIDILKWRKKMTAKPSDMARQKLQAVADDHDLFWEEYGQAVDDVTELYKHYEREHTSNPHAAATLTLDTVMNLEEIGE